MQYGNIMRLRYRSCILSLTDFFLQGDYHLAMVNQIVERENADPAYELQGVVTLEDIVEEILQVVR